MRGRLTVLAALTLAAASGQESKVNMAEMMATTKKFTQPGPSHKLLERFIGDWTMDFRFVMGGKEGPAAIGEQKCRWTVKDRWVECRQQWPFMGTQAEAVMTIGYDNFKKSYRVMMITSIDTAMNVSEGDLTRDGKTLLTYGTLDEYLTGEHDKMVKYVWRFESADVMRTEVHDLPIGETGTQVIATKLTRKAGGR